ncbi:MAG TPA: hypothetical protein VF796_26215, partial [Humisphaera sp.]
APQQARKPQQPKQPKQPKRKQVVPPPIPSAMPAAPEQRDAYAVPPAPTAAPVRSTASARAGQSNAPLLDGSNPRSLRAQFVLSEILKPPLSMREP